MKRLIALAAALLLCLSPALAKGLPPLGEDETVASLPGKQWALHSLNGLVTEKITQITGENTANKTLSRFGVWGTDLGSMAELDGKVYMFGGDTFASESNANWRSNVLFFIEDEDPSDGLTITGAVTDRRGIAKELLRSLKVDHKEMTVIPTNLFAANGKLYCVYMSVSHWGDAGKWDTRYSGLAVSEDSGETWKKLSSVQWPGDSGFIQTASVQIGQTMYFWAIPAGRFGGVYLMKAPVDKLEEFSAYSYYTGLDETGAPRWQQGDEGIQNAALVIEAPAGEISVIYNEYLGNFIITYLNERKAAIVMREGVTPWGEFSQETVLAKSSDYPALYGAYMLPKYVENKGQSFYFAMSQFFPVYNIMWMRTTLPWTD